VALVVVNPDSGSSDAFRLIQNELRARRHHTVRETRRPGDGAMWVRKALATSTGPVDVAVMGGDGTIHHLVNNIGDDLDRVRLALLPAGTGNDLARSLGIPLEPEAAFELLEEGGDYLDLDVMRVQTEDDVHLGLNALHGGYGGRIGREVDEDAKERFGPFAYLSAGAEAFDAFTDYETHVRWRDGTSDHCEGMGVLIANGGSVGGGFSVAPDVDPTDGVFDVYVFRAETVLDWADVAAHVAAGRLDRSDRILHRATRGVAIASRPPMAYSLDGEPLSEWNSFAVERHETSLSILVPSEDETS
jgi:diacylglycerol kinase (ATP)